MTMNAPLIAVTMGDPAGIGPRSSPRRSLTRFPG